LEHDILQEVVNIASKIDKPKDIAMVETLSDQGDIFLNAGRVEKSPEASLWLRLFCIEIYEACLSLIPKEWKQDPESIPYISNSTTDTLPKNLKEYTERYPPFWRSIHNLAIVITDLHGFIVMDNDDQHDTCRKLSILINQLVNTYSTYTIYEQSFPSPIANWARLFLDCGSDMMDEDPKQSQELLATSICLFAKEMDITDARQLVVEYDSVYCYADALIRMAAVKPVEPTQNYFDQMDELLDKSYQAFQKCCELKPTDFITIYRTGLVVIRKINLIVMMLEQDVHNQELVHKRKLAVTRACEYFAKCIQVQDYYRAHEMWGIVLYDEAERLRDEWLQMTTDHVFENELYSTLQQSIDQFYHAQRVMNRSLGDTAHMVHYCEQDIACATSRQFEIRLRQWQQAKHQEQCMLDALYMGTLKNNKLKLKNQKILVKQLKKDMNKLHVKSMTIFESLSEKQKLFAHFHIARLRCLMGDENQTKRNLYKLLNSAEYDTEIDTKGEVIFKDSAFASMHEKVWFKKFVKQFGMRNQRLVQQMEC
jgi:hypothetical protein